MSGIPSTDGADWDSADVVRWYEKKRREYRHYPDYEAEGGQIYPWHSSDPCPHCSTLMFQICVSWSYDDGFSQYEHQCLRCGYAVDEDREPVESPYPCDQEGAFSFIPSPSAVYLAYKELARSDPDSAA